MIIDGRLPLIVSFIRAGTTGSTKPVDPAHNLLHPSLLFEIGRCLLSYGIRRRPLYLPLGIWRRLLCLRDSMAPSVSPPRDPMAPLLSRRRDQVVPRVSHPRDPMTPVSSIRDYSMPAATPAPVRRVAELLLLRMYHLCPASG